MVNGNETKVKYSKDDGGVARLIYTALFNPPRGVKVVIQARCGDQTGSSDFITFFSRDV